MNNRKKENEDEKKKKFDNNKEINDKCKDDDIEIEKHDSNDDRFFNGSIQINIENIEDRFVNELQGLIGDSVLIVTESDQLNLFGQTFRPIFCGTIINVSQGDVTLFPVNIKMINAPFFQFPTPLSIPLEKIAHFTPNFDCNERIPLT